ncbi:acyl-CoA synthetase (AMP-forming)/AMP-acid ligase II [Bradyrhizobium sp. LM6.11]
MSTKALNFAPREVRIERRPDGALILRSPLEWAPCDWRVTDFLPSWAAAVPDRVFLAQRNAGGGWDEITYGEAWSQVQAAGQSLIDMGAKPADKLAVLSGNSIENAVISFAAMSIGVILAPISPNYTLMPGGLARLKDIAETLRPNFVFVQSGRDFSAGRAIPELAEAAWISVDGAPDTVPFRTLAARTGSDGFERASRAVSCDAVAKILFTSGSTGFPKGVLNTHRMMASSLQMGSLLVSPPEAPVQVEWLPWHHTMGSNVILHSILKNGGTLYIDDGRPLPQLFHKTVANLKDVSPTAMFNVPAGYNLLCDAIENDLYLGASVFKRMDRLSYAGAAISQATLEKLYRLTFAGHRPANSGHVRLRRHRNGPDNRHHPLGDRSAGRDRSSSARPATETDPCVRYLRGQDQGTQRHSRLSRKAGFDGAGLRRGRILPHRRHGLVSGSREAGARPAVHRQNLRKFQTRERHVGPDREYARGTPGGNAWRIAGHRRRGRKS